jgi:NADH dehydrogenase
MAGALAEMKKYIFPKDYPDLDLSKMRILLYEASGQLLSGMSASASRHALEYLEKLGVEVHLNTGVTDYDGTRLALSDNTTLDTRTVIWAAGITGNVVKGIAPESIGPQGRITVDRQNRVSSMEDIYAIGDIARMGTPSYPQGHPQVAQVAIQQAIALGRNLSLEIEGEKKAPKDFEYKDKGSMATIGRHLAVADLPGIRLKGYIAWVLWSIVHLFTIVGVKNRLFIFLNWSWNYFTYDQSLRLLIRHKPLKAFDSSKPRQEREAKRFTSRSTVSSKAKVL